MYRLLLVDDEPLILSGIKFLLDWEKNDCQIIDTARNGQEALNKIRSLKPDIILCDINMPVMSGIDLLSTVSKEMPSVVFIMLTNLQDFDLVKSALQLKAVDYVVKSQLEAEALESSLSHAKEEWIARNRLVTVSHIENQEKMINELFLKELLLHPGSSLKVKEMSNDLSLVFPVDSYALLYLIFDYNEKQEREDLFRWEKEVVAAMSQKHFKNFHLFEPDNTQDSLMLLCSSLPVHKEEYTCLIRQFYHKLTSYSSNITQISVRIMGTECFHGPASLTECRNQLDTLIDYYYNLEEDFSVFYEIPTFSCQPLGLTGLSAYLLEAVRERSYSRCCSLFTKALSRIQGVHHQRSLAIWLCTDTYTAISEEFRNSIPSSQLSTYFSQPETTLLQLERIHTRSQVTTWLEYLRDSTICVLEQMSSDRNSFIKAAMQYVEDHIEEHISLSDAADYVNISPAYFSSCFSKSCGQSFIDYVNSRKMEYACRLLRNHKCLIYEISYQLGFNNAYYFTKIFKRHVGMTPIEYQNLYKDTGQS